VRIAPQARRRKSPTEQEEIASFRAQKDKSLIYPLRQLLLVRNAKLDGTSMEQFASFANQAGLPMCRVCPTVYLALLARIKMKRAKRIAVYVNKATPAALLQGCRANLALSECLRSALE
jgi:hypothetical protein